MCVYKLSIPVKLSVYLDCYLSYYSVHIGLDFNELILLLNDMGFEIVTVGRNSQYRDVDHMRCHMSTYCMLLTTV